LTKKNKTTIAAYFM